MTEAIADIFHEEQVRIWAQEIIETLALGDLQCKPPPTPGGEGA